MTHIPRVRDLLREQGRDDALLIGGGIIPEEDADRLEGEGVAKLFGPGTSTREIIEFINTWAEDHLE
jgi:methylmalonyl-CoA mutase C-terminal domain/subunit